MAPGHGGPQTSLELVPSQSREPAPRRYNHLTLRQRFNNPPYEGTNARGIGCFEALHVFVALDTIHRPSRLPLPPKAVVCPLPQLLWPFGACPP